MGDTFNAVRALVTEGKVHISEHDYDELAADNIDCGLVVEDYPQSAKGPSVLVLQTDALGRPIHVLWGIPRGRTEPAVVVTAYRPDPTRWTDDLMKRKQR